MTIRAADWTNRVNEIRQFVIDTLESAVTEGHTAEELIDYVIQCVHADPDYQEEHGDMDVLRREVRRYITPQAQNMDDKKYHFFFAGDDDKIIHWSMTVKEFAWYVNDQGISPRHVRILDPHTERAWDADVSMSIEELKSVVD